MDNIYFGNMTRSEMMKRIKELEFAVIELNIYLDNHPMNQQALMDFNKFTKELMDLKEKYEEQHGMLTNFGYSTSQYPWTWVNEPWPWESGE